LSDVQLLGPTATPVSFVRARDEEVGVDSFTATSRIRNADNNLVIGRADFGWRELMSRP